MRIIDAKAEIIGGVIDAAAELSGQVIEANAQLVNEVRATTFPDYSGEYEVTPTEEAQTLNTAETVLLENVTVDAIPADYVGSEIPRQTGLSVSGLTVSAGAGYYEETVSETVTPNLQSASESYTPTESTQTDTIFADLYHDGLSSVEITVGAIPADYVGSEIPRRDALSVSGATVSGAAGYYDEAVSATVSSGSATTPATSITANPSISVGSDGLISASVSKTQSVTPTVQEGYVTTGTAGNVTVSGSNTSQLPTQAGTTITPSTSEQTAVPAGKFTTGAVKVAAMPSGTEGTPVATKGAVSGHSVTVTPSVTNSAGYISGGTHTGTGVTVSASELVSGSETKTSNGTYDVTNLAELVVNVSGGGGSGLTKLATTDLGTISTSSTSAADTGQTLDVEGFDAYDLLICITHTSPHTNNRNLGTIRLVNLAATSNVNTKTGTGVATSTQNIKLSSGGVIQTRVGTTPYGVYVNTATLNTSGTRRITLTIYQRYNSTSSGTINGHYVLDVYGLKLSDLL